MTKVRFSRAARLGLFVVVVVIMQAIPFAAVAATELYVDRSSPNCSDSGPGTPAVPFCTINRAAAVVTAGQTVRVSSGIYPEHVTVVRSGTSTARIVFTEAPGASVTVSGRTRGFTITNKSWVTIQGFTITTTAEEGVEVRGSSNVTVQGLVIAGTNEDGIKAKDSSNITISGNHVSDSGQPVSGETAKGIRVENTTDSLVSANVVEHNTDHGIYVAYSSSRVTVMGNETSFNAKGFVRAAGGIFVYKSTNNTIERNISHHNEDSGLQTYNTSSDNLIRNNVSYDNGDHGIDVLDASRNRLISNTVYNNVTAGINVEGASSSATVANNISVDNGIGSPRTKGNIRVDSTSTSGTTVDYNLVFLRAASPMYVWGSTSYATLAAFQAASGQEAHGIQSDPRWASPGAGNLHLTAGSSAIDSANSGASGQSAVDTEANGRVDDPGTPNTGAGPRAYDDRGAYEFQGVTQPDDPPVAALTVTPESGTMPLVVTADASASTDTGSTPIDNYRFDFGDGSPAVGPQPGATATHTYDTAGTFTVTVTVTDTAGLSSTATDTVTVQDAPPVAALTVTPSSGTTPLAVTADASASTDTDSTPIDTYRFDFGDGSPIVGPQPGATATHTYTAAGTFTVTVTVRDTAGLSSTATATVNANNDPPVAALTVTPSSGTTPLAVTADASASTDTDADPIDTYRFDFGDGSPAVGPQPGPTATHTYTSAGNFIVTVTVRDTAGLASSATMAVTAQQQLVGNPGFETDTSGWNTSGSGTTVSLTRVAGGHSGGWAAKLVNTGTVSGTCSLNDSPNWVLRTSAGTYTGRLWVRGDTAGATFKLRFREYNGTTLVGSQTTTITLTTSWQQIVVSYAPSAVGSSTLDLSGWVPNASPGTCFYADDASVILG